MHTVWRRLVYYLFIFCIISLPLTAEESGWSKLDPFLRKELNRVGFGAEVFNKPEADLLQLQTIPPELQYHVVIVGEDEYLRDLPIQINSRYRGFVTAKVTLDELHSISIHPGVDYIEKGGYYQFHLDRSIPDINVNDVHLGIDLLSPLKGRNVILGFIDTGIDFLHPDFGYPGDPDRTRILSIWDMGLSPVQGENNPENFNYGVEYTQSDIETDLRSGERSTVRSIDNIGHGTHIAGIAGGNGIKSAGRYTGVAPEAYFVIVRSPTLTTAQILDGMNYIFSVADELGMPAVVNLSFGTHGGSHDGTSTIEQAVDQNAEWPGRAVTISAGNSGDSNIHTGGVVEPNRTATFAMDVDFYQPGNQNEIIHFLWYEGTANAELQVKTPTGIQVRTTTGKDLVEQTNDGTIEIIAPFTINPKNARVFGLFIHDDDGVRPASGIWEFEFTPLTGTKPVSYNNWLVFSTMDNISMTPNTGRRYTVSMPGTAKQGITVGAYATKTTWADSTGEWWQVVGATGSIASFSSGGPTRDGRLKPEITAPGFVVASTNSMDAQVPVFFTDSVNGYSINAGTSMSAPHVMGVIALLFEKNPSLRSDHILDILKNSGRTDDRTGTTPNMTWGYGKVNAQFVANASFRYVDVPNEFRLFQNYPNPFNPSTKIEFTIPRESAVKLAVYDLLGREVEILIDEVLEPRHYIVNFDAVNLSSGFYYYRLQSDAFTETKSMLYLK